jgi:hypothetical protein
MNAFLNIITVTKPDVYAVPLSAIVTDHRGSFIHALDNNGNGETRELPVTIGLKTSTQAEISGADLQDGLMILARP